jgi:hypothetical protein
METEGEVYRRLERYHLRGQADVQAIFTLERGWHIVNVHDPQARPVVHTAPPDEIPD